MDSYICRSDDFNAFFNIKETAKIIIKPIKDLKKTIVSILSCSEEV